MGGSGASQLAWNEINIDTDVDGFPVTGRWIIILQIATENGMDTATDHIQS